MIITAPIHGLLSHSAKMSGKTRPSSVRAATAERIRSRLVVALQRDSGEMPLWDKLNRIKCPVLIPHGGLPGSYLQPEPGYYGSIRTVRNFLSQMDNLQPVKPSKRGNQPYPNCRNVIVVSLDRRLAVISCTRLGHVLHFAPRLGLAPR